MSPFQSLRDYELFVYDLREQYENISSSTLLVIQRAPQYAELTGEVAFAKGFRLSVFERLVWEKGSLSIEGYSYEVWRNSEKLYWYDSQPHPDNPSLASTHPHHKHISPDIKHHRIPAPGFSFWAPNLPTLIVEIEQLIAATNKIKPASM